MARRPSSKNPLSFVGQSGITDPESALNAARRTPERPLLVPAEDVGPSPSFGLATSRGHIGGYPVPATMFEGHSGAALDSLEAHLYLGSVERVSPVAVQ